MSKFINSIDWKAMCILIISTILVLLKAIIKVDWITATSDVFVVVGAILYILSIFASDGITAIQKKHFKETENMAEQIADIAAYQKENVLNSSKICHLEAREKLIQNLIHNGKISIKDLYEATKSNKVICAISYGEGIEKNMKEKLKKVLPRKDYNKIKKILPSVSVGAKILDELKFVRCFKQWTIYFKFVNDIPKAYREIDVIKNLIEKRFEEKWNEMLARVKRLKIPNKKRVINILNDHKLTYILLKAEPHEFLLSYIHRYSFIPPFINYLSSVVDHNKSKKIFEKKRTDIKSFLTKVSIFDLLITTPQKIRKIFLHKDNYIRKRFKISSFLDYGALNRVDLSNYLSRFLNSKQKYFAEKTAAEIFELTAKYQVELKSMGINL